MFFPGRPEELQAEETLTVRQTVEALLKLRHALDFYHTRMQINGEMDVYMGKL